MQGSTWRDDVLDDLVCAGHRITRPRRQILEYILCYTIPFTGEELVTAIEHTHMKIGRATIYRTLELLHRHEWLHVVHRCEGEHGIFPINGGDTEAHQISTCSRAPSHMIMALRHFS